MHILRKLFPSKNKKLSDNARLAQVTARANKYGDVNDSATPRPLLTLEEFFEGNDDFGSIGYNFHPHQPAPSAFYAAFTRIRALPHVADVRVEIAQQDDMTMWPITDTIWIITSADPTTVQQWLGDQFRGDEVYEGWVGNMLRESLLIPSTMKPIGIWWD